MPLHEMSIYTEKTSSNKAVTIGTSSTPNLVAQLGSYKTQSLVNISTSVQQQQQQQQQELLPMKYGCYSDTGKLSTEDSIGQCDQRPINLLDYQGQKWSDVIDFDKALNELHLAELRLNGDYSSGSGKSNEGTDEGTNATRKQEQLINQESDDNRRWRHKNLRQVQRLFGDDIHFYGIVPKATALKLAVCDICMGVYTTIGLKKHFMIHHPAMWSNLSTSIGALTATSSLSSSSVSRSEKHHSENIHDTTSSLVASSSSSSMQQINADLFGSSPSDGTMSAGSSLSSCSTSNTASNMTIGYIPNISTTNKRQKASRGGQSSSTGSGSKSSKSRSRNKGKHNKTTNEIANVPLNNNPLLPLDVCDALKSSNACVQHMPEVTSITTSKKSSKRKHVASNVAPNVSIAQFENVGSSKGTGSEINVNILAATTKEPIANTEAKALNNVVFNNLPTTAINLNSNCSANANALILGNHNRIQNIKNFAVTASLSSTSSASLTSGLYPPSNLSLTLSSSSSSNSSTSSTSSSMPLTPKMISTTIQEGSVISGHTNLPIITEYPLSPIVLTMKDSSNSNQDAIAATALLQQNYDNSSIKTNNKKKVKKSSSNHSGRKSSHSSTKGQSLVVSQRKDHSNKITIVKLPILPSTTSSANASTTSQVVGITANCNNMDHCAQQQTEQYRAQIIELNQAVNSITELNADDNDYNATHQMGSQGQQQQQYHNSQQVVDFAISNHHQELQEGNHGCVQNDVGSIHHNNSSEDSVMLKHVLEEFNMLDSKVINEILNSSENDINFDETQLSDVANGGGNHQQQQQQLIDMYVMEQQNDVKRIRYDGQLTQSEQPTTTPMMLSVNRENGQFTIYPQQQQQQQSQTTYGDATIYTQTTEETQLDNQFQQPMENIQLQNLIYQQHHQPPSVVAYETVVDDVNHHEALPQEQQQTQLTESLERFYSDADHNQAPGQIQLFTEMNNDKLKQDDKTEVYATLYTAGNDNENQIIESFEIDTVPSLTDDNEVLLSDPSSASCLSNTYVISNQDNESQYQIYQIDNDQRCMELMQNQNDASSQYHSIQSDIIVNVAKDSNESQSINMATASYEEINPPQPEMKQIISEEEEQKRLIAEELLDFDYSLIETINSKSAESSTKKINQSQCQDFGRETLRHYSGIPRPLSINTFGLRKLPQSVSTTFQKSLQNSRKANNSLTSLTAGLRSTFLSGTRTSLLSSSNRFGNSYHKQQPIINNFHVNNPVVVNGLNQINSYYSCNMTEGNNNATNTNWMNGGGLTHNNSGIHLPANIIKSNNNGNRIKISSIAGGNSGIGVILPGFCINNTKNRYNLNNSLNDNFPVPNLTNNTINNKEVNSTASASNMGKTILVTGSVNAFNANQQRLKAITSRNGLLHRNHLIQRNMDNNYIPLITTNRLNDLLNSNEHSLKEMRGLLESSSEELEEESSNTEDSVLLNTAGQNVAKRLCLLKMEEPKNYPPPYLLTENEEHTVNHSETPCNPSVPMMTNGENLWNEGLESFQQRDYSRVNNFYEKRRKLLNMGHQHHQEYLQHSQLSKSQLLEYEIDCSNNLSNNLATTWQQSQQQQPQQTRLFQQSVTRNMSDCGINSNNVSNNVPSNDVMQVFV